MEPSNYDEIPLCKALNFVRGTELSFSVPLHAMEALEGRGGIASTHS
jgi:hypothetical protein